MRSLVRLAVSTGSGVAYGAGVSAVIWLAGADLPWYAAAAVTFGVAATLVAADLSDPLNFPDRSRL